MERKVFLAVFVIFAIFGIAVPSLISGSGKATSPGKGSFDDSQLFANIWDREPVLFYETTGFSFGGPIHRRLAVYTDGSASASTASSFGGSQNMDAEFAFIPVEVVEKLRTDLIRADAHRLGDSINVIKDLPLSTITFFKDPGPKAQSNSFNYFAAFGRWSVPSKVVNDFIDAWFPGF